MSAMPLLDLCRRENSVIETTVKASGVSKRLASVLAQKCLAFPTLIDEAWKDIFDELPRLLALPGDGVVEVIGRETVQVFADTLATIAMVADLVARHQLFDEQQRLEETAARIASMRDAFAQRWPWAESQSHLEKAALRAYEHGQCSAVEDLLRELQWSRNTTSHGR